MQRGELLGHRSDMGLEPSQKSATVLSDGAELPIHQGRGVASTVARKLEPAENPYEPECNTRHAGKVFVISQKVLHAVNAEASDNADISLIGDRLLLCLWDLDDGTSLWIELQSSGEYEIAHNNKRLYGKDDPNWMDENKPSKYRMGTILRLGRPGFPVNYTQKQKRAVTLEQLRQVQEQVPKASIEAWVDCNETP